MCLILSMLFCQYKSEMDFCQLFEFLIAMKKTMIYNAIKERCKTSSGGVIK